jgi:hypothetical protein
MVDTTATDSLKSNLPLWTQSLINTLTSLWDQFMAWAQNDLPNLVDSIDWSFGNQAHVAGYKKGSELGNAILDGLDGNNAKREQAIVEGVKQLKAGALDGLIDTLRKGVLGERITRDDFECAMQAILTKRPDIVKELGGKSVFLARLETERQRLDAETSHIEVYSHTRYKQNRPQKTLIGHQAVRFQLTEDSDTQLEGLNEKDKDGIAHKLRTIASKESAENIAGVELTETGLNLSLEDKTVTLNPSSVSVSRVTPRFIQQDGRSHNTSLIRKKIHYTIETTHIDVNAKGKLVFLDTRSDVRGEGNILQEYSPVLEHNAKAKELAVISDDLARDAIRGMEHVGEVQLGNLIGPGADMHAPKIQLLFQ